MPPLRSEKYPSILSPHFFTSLFLAFVFATRSPRQPPRKSDLTNRGQCAKLSWTSPRCFSSSHFTSPRTLQIWENELRTSVSQTLTHRPTGSLDCAATSNDLQTLIEVQQRSLTDGLVYDLTTLYRFSISGKRSKAYDRPSRSSTIAFSTCEHLLSHEDDAIEANSIKELLSGTARQ